MIKNWSIPLFFTLLLVLISGTALVSSQTGNISKLELISPQACPTSGCAAGQRLNLRVTIALNVNFPEENTQICFTSTDAHPDPGIQKLFDVSDGYLTSISGLPYERKACTHLFNTTTETELFSVFFRISDTTTSDQLDLALKLDDLATLDGSLKFYLLQKDSNGDWVLTDTVKSDFLVTGSQVADGYVAENENTCGPNFPCFINSGDDLIGGIGTGLKDAIDALPEAATINIVSNYSIKSNAVLVNKSHTISGLPGSKVVSQSDAGCTNPMFSITGASVIQNLNMDDGICVSPSRDLIYVRNLDETHPTIIQKNTLKKGSRAIVFDDADGNLIVRFNNISQNDSFAFERTSSIKSGSATILANNIYGNNGTNKTQVNCLSPAKGSADHNYWGEGVSTQDAVSNCTFTENKRLGAPVVELEAGVRGDVADNVTTVPVDLLDSSVTVKQTSNTPYQIYIVDYGLEKVPFGVMPDNLIVFCSNYYDIFLGFAVQTDTDLIASIKYDQNSYCQAVIESGNYCGTSDVTPLWWYDPKNNLTDKWDRVGSAPEGTGSNSATGQLVTCNMSTNVITMTLDSSGRPNLSEDLNFTPFVVALAEGIKLTDAGFTASYQLNRTNLYWNTTVEENIKGFYIQRSTSKTSGYARVSGFIEAVGSPNIGGIYKFIDEPLAYGTTYYYRLEVINTLNFTVHVIGPISVDSATKTPTVTHTYTSTTTPTKTSTPTITATRTVTPTRTQYYYRSPTPRYYYTNTPIIYNTATSRFQTATPEINQTQDQSYPTMTSESITLVPVVLTETSIPAETNSTTNTPTLTSTSSTAISNSWLKKSDRYLEQNLWGLIIGVLVIFIGMFTFGWFVKEKR